MATKSPASGHSKDPQHLADSLARTPSGIEVPVTVTPDMAPGTAPDPSEFPFTRGIFPNGYRGRLWTIRQYSGFGTAEATNERYKFLLDKGLPGFEYPTSWLEYSVR